MSGLAQVLLARGVRVSGSDPHENAAIERLRAQSATHYATQTPSNIALEKPDLVVVTAAIPPDNAELNAARAAGISVVSRAEFLGRVMADYGGARIAVAGTHGKTTTTSMLASVLIAGELDPTVLVGGEYAPIGGNVRVSASDTFLTEACEAYDSFLQLRPSVTVITNIEADHLDYYETEERVFESFRRFIDQTDSDGLLVWCGDDPGARKLIEGLSADQGPRRRIAYGLEPNGEGCVWATAVHSAGAGSRFLVRYRNSGADKELGSVSLCVPGTHNVLNALAAAAVGIGVGVPFGKIAEALHGFCGTGRRFEKLAEQSGIVVIDDYAHHPTEMRATIGAARAAYPDRRLVLLFQPHLYSRTRDFMDEFAASLSEADAILVTDIYAAREKPIAGVKIIDLTKRIAERVPDKTLLYLDDRREWVDALRWVSRPGDLVMTMGAGDIREAGESFAASLQ